MPNASSSTSSRKIDPYISNLFCCTHVPPMDFEERRARGISAEEYANDDLVPIDFGAIEFGMHTDALIHYMKARIPCDSNADANQFKIHMFQCMLMTLEEYALLPHCTQSNDYIRFWRLVQDQKEWLPPCKNRRGCTGLCRALCTKLSVYLRAVSMARYFASRVDDDMMDMIAINNIYAHIDSHIPMMLLVEKMHGKNATACVESIWLAAYKHEMPDLQYAYTEHTTPDLSVFMPLSTAYNHWGIVSNKNGARNKFPDMEERDINIVLSIVNLLYKLIPHRCNNRESHNSISNACKTNPNMIELICKLFIASWLGVYRTSKTKLDVRSRMIVYRMFAQETRFVEVMGTFCSENTTTLMYMAKEYYYNLASHLPGFQRAMEKSYEWSTYCKYVADINEIIRIKIAANMRDLIYDTLDGIKISKVTCMNDFFRGVDAMIIKRHEDCRQFQRTNNVGYNLEAILATCTNINYNSYEYLDHAAQVVPGEEYKLPSPNPTVAPEMQALMKNIVSRYPRNQFIPLDWLVCFGVPVHKIVEMKRAVFSKMPDLQSLLIGLSREMYAIFYCFIKTSHLRDIYAEFPADAAMYYHHCMALLRTYKIGDGEKMPKVAGTVQACDNCGDIKQSSFYYRTVKGKHADGKNNVMITDTGETVCACHPARASWRDIYYSQNGEHAPSLEKVKEVRWTGETLNRKASKTVTGMVTKSLCQTEPTRTLNACGRICKYNGVVYVGCFHDLRLAPLESMRHIGDRIVCPECHEKIIESEKEKKATDPVHELKCEYCSARILADAYRAFTLRDDRPELEMGAPQIRTMYFCKNHYPLQWVRTGGFVRRSDVIRGIQERWDTKTGDGRTIPYIKTPSIYESKNII